MSTKTIISANQLTKYYGKVIGINKITFTVNKGEIFGFLGPNGAGKTTTIRLLLDLLRPTSGEIAIFGKTLPHNSYEIRQKCGYLPGDFSPYKNLTGEEFLNLSAKIRGVNPVLQHMLINEFALENSLTRKIKHLSHGNRQKIGIIQAFFHEPELVILDEPTIGLDPLIQEKFYIFLRQYQKSGKTIFFSSHNLPEVEKICNRVAIIRKGELVALETLEALRKKRYRRLKITLKRPVDQLKLPNAKLYKKQGLNLEFLIKGESATLIKHLSKLPIADFTYPEPDLEEIFMYYYREEKHD